MITEKQFKKMLEEHDWYYELSDDHIVWQSGKYQLDKIKENITTESRKILFNKYKNKHKLPW